MRKMTKPWHMFSVHMKRAVLSAKRNAMFLFAILGVKIIDLKKRFNSVVLPSNKDIECIVSS